MSWSPTVLVRRPGPRSTLMVMRYRGITEAEIPVAAEIQSRAFRTQVENYLTNYREGGRYDWRAVRVLENQEGRPVAALSLFERMMSLNGGEIAAGLIASVGVPPEERRRGYANRLMRGALEELYEQQIPVSLLFPFSTAFYRRLGYALVNLNWFLDIPPRYLPDFPERLAVRRALPDDDGAIRACYERAREQPRHNGWLRRTSWEWEKRVAGPEREVVVYPADGTIEGYLVYTLTPDFQQSITTVKVIEWVSATDGAWRGLTGFLSTLGDQVRAIAYNAPRGSPLVLALQEPYSEGGRSAEFVFYQVARLVSGFMLRVVHLPRALQTRRFPATVTGEILLRVDDAQLPANAEALRVRFANGAAEVAPADGSFQRGKPGTVETDIATFSQLFCGFASAEAARTTGHLQADDSTCALLTSAFAAAPLYLHRADWF